MNVFQATLVFISVVAAKGSFPAVIVGSHDSLAQPAILPFSDNEMKIGFDYTYGVLYTACPLLRNQREEDALPEVLARRPIVTGQEATYLDEISLCELQPQVTYQKVAEERGSSLYWIGYKVYSRRIEDRNGGSIFYTSRDEHDIGKVFTLNFKTTTTKTILVEYELGYYSEFISTASNRKHTYVYKKNEEFLKIDIDILYQNFIDKILPRMEEEKSRNQLAHALGIQKVQLATPDDFVLDTWKMATYWNINTVPIWRVLILRWNAIEIYLRKVYKRYIDMRVQTGVSGSLKIAERYYENDTVPKLHIPKYMCKLIPSDFSNSIVMLIVMHNDPFTENQQPLCVDICAINGWLVSNDDYRTGLAYCCKMTENIAQILGYSKDTKKYGIYSFTKEEDGTENLGEISLILSDPLNRLYDW